MLLEHRASVGRGGGFVKSPKNNLRRPVWTLSRVVNINPKYAVEDGGGGLPDRSRRESSEENPRSSVSHDQVAQRGGDCGEKDDGVFATRRIDTREETVHQTGELAERYAPTTRWFIETMNTIFAIGGDVVGCPPPTTSCASSARFQDDAADAALRASAVASYLDILDANPKIPEVLLEVIVWVVGEFGTLSGKSAAELMDALCAAVDAQSAGDAVRAQAR